MLQILSLYLSKLKVDLYFTFMMRVVEFVDKCPVVGEMFGYYVEQLKAAFGYFNQVHLKYDPNFFTEKLKKADSERDKAYRALREGIRYLATFATDAEKKQAAEVLLKITDLYGGSGVVNMNMSAKTASIVNLLEDLEEKFQAEVAAAGIAPLAAELKAVQAEFDKIYLDRVEYDAEATKQALDESRKRLDSAYRDLVTVVNLEAKRDTEGRLTEFINMMNVEIKRNFIYTKQTVGGSAASGGGADGEATIPTKTVRFEFAGGRVETIKAEVGAAYAIPLNTEGYVWDPLPTGVMPAKNTTFREVALEDREVVLTFHFLSHEDEELRGVVGTLLNAPVNTEGCHWEPAVPNVFPEVDMTFNEVLDEAGGENLVTAFFKFNNGSIEEIRAAAGAALTAPGNTAGYLWSPEVPRTMPAENFRFVEVPEGETLHTVAWYNQLGNPVQWYELPAGMTIPEAPEPPEGYEWHPYPDVMPDHDLDIVPNPVRG